MIYLYETIAVGEGAETKHFQIEQSTNGPALTKHPETGEPIRRVILGGWGSVPSKPSGGSATPGDCGCGPSGCC